MFQFGTCKTGQRLFYKDRYGPRFDAIRVSWEHLGMAAGMARIEENLDYLVLTVDTGCSNLGLSLCVKVGPNDSVFWAKKHGKKPSIKFVRYRKPEPTSLVTMRLKRIADGYNLTAAYYGDAAPLFPSANKAEPNSVEFWNKHALVIDNPSSINWSTIQDKMHTR